ncbi:NUDIX hydrolase [Saccharopolyspora phatthalungensis]|uniref:8-oxo-dGTP pyrophosphatase MutT (NUDIX family) n=1 Tax=Saccharopolyspora phatthalungensis TaxID=664693 RepID=A0A840PQN9_9PSEU|nr:NUDIX domain-containing protein [Saccharopolyspora phatthalungensis]MBB5152622.1 8-oxo-dGTP pyrophosphatase MutT (NUDIX family) [Saccharopolyspora phatthalungensis]
MSAGDESVAIYDAAGRVVGSATRRRMRAEGLWHAVGEVLVLSPDRKEVYVHRRTDSKDIYPGMHDCWAGGVIAAGEDPEVTARRELAEELGVRGAPVRFLFQTVHQSGSVRFHGFLYETQWDGPIVHQAEEIAEGWWMPLAELRARLRDPQWPFVPDGRQFIKEWFAHG